MKTNVFFSFLFVLCLMAVSSKVNANTPLESSSNADYFNKAVSSVTSGKHLHSLPLVSFFTTDTIIVVSPEKCRVTDTDKTDIENAVYWDQSQTRPVYIYKTEGELSKKDTRRHLLFVGCIHQFKRTGLLDIPVTRAPKGFRFADRTFRSPEDSFYYINPKADRMYLCKNSPTSRHSFFSIGGTPFPLHVFSNNRVVLTGYNN